jgi:predicted phage gp36 major capsid-like protein
MFEWWVAVLAGQVVFHPRASAPPHVLSKQVFDSSSMIQVNATPLKVSGV